MDCEKVKKSCSKCRKELEVESNFYKRGKYKNGNVKYNSICKKCYKDWAIENENHLESYRNVYYYLHKEQRLSSKTTWANNLSRYDNYYYRLIEACRKTQEGYLEVKCVYCGKWYIPKNREVTHRITAIEGRLYNSPAGENRLYCSKDCKSNCPIYNQKKYEKGHKQVTSREVQPELRKLVFERDGWTCIKCMTTTNLHCHHIEGIHHNPIESTDTDLCITLCKSCHKEVHKQKDCRYDDMKCK